MDILKNQAFLNGMFDGEALTLDSTIAETTIVTGLIATKTASRQLWATGPLEYTITITNSTDIDFENPIFTDALDGSIVSLIANSVMVDGSPAVYTYAASLLSINLPAIPGGETLIVTFQVQKI